jgi:hypothetical protein
MIIGRGAVGSAGNGPATAAWLLSANLLLAAASFRAIKPSLTDNAFAAFVLCFAISTFLSFETQNWKEYVLFLLCVPAPYLAGRFMRVRRINQLPRAALGWSSAFVAVATSIVIFAVYREGMHGSVRTTIFGLAETQTIFASALGCMSIAFIYSDIPANSPRSRLFLFLIFAATAAFVVALVRFAIVAIAVTAIFSMAVLHFQKESIARRAAISVLVACLLGIGAATLIRPGGVSAFAGEAIRDMATETYKAASARAVKIDRDKLPSCRQETDGIDRSVHVRALLLGDAFYLLPKADFFGLGLDSFPALTCITGYQVHNIFLQAFVELGWIAGFLLLLLCGVPLIYLRDINIDRDCLLARNFLVTSLAFFSLIGLAHGSVSRTLPLFLVMGALSSFYANEPIPKSSLSAKIGPTSC